MTVSGLEELDRGLFGLGGEGTEDVKCFIEIMKTLHTRLQHKNFSKKTLFNSWLCLEPECRTNEFLTS